MDFKEKNIADEIINFNMSAMQEFTNYYNEGKKNIEASYGDHFTAQQKKDISAQGRTPVGLPILFPKVQSLIGFEKDNRDHLEAEPAGAEDELTTELINPLLRHIELQDKPKKYEFTKSDIYLDAIVPCFGVSEIYMETNEYKKKEVFIKQIPYNQMLFDLNFTDYEMSGCRRFQQHWNTYLDDVLAENPDKKDMIEKVEEDFNDADRFPQREFMNHYYNDTDEPGKKRVKRIRDWKKVNKKLWYLNDIQNKTKYEFITKEEAEQERDKLISARLLEQTGQAIPGLVPSGDEAFTGATDSFIIESEPKDVWEYTEIAGTVVIVEPEILDIPDECPITITYSIFMMGKWFTPVGIMRGLQEFLDRLFQQLDYSIGIDAKGGAEVDVNLIANEYNTVEDLKVAYVNGGLVFKDGQGTLFNPMKRTGANPQYFQLFEIFFQLLEDGFGGRNFQGSQEAGGQQSGRAISQLLAVAQVLTNNYLDNLRRSDLLMGRKLMKYIKKYYDYEFTLSVVGESLQKEVIAALEKNGLYKPSMMKEGKGWLTYDPANSNVKPISDTSVVLNLTKVSARLDEKEMTRASLLALQQAGFAIPLKAHIDSLPLKATLKTEIIAYNEQIQAQQQQMQLQQMKNEALNQQTKNLTDAGKVSADMLNAQSQFAMNKHLINQPDKDQNPNQ